MGKLKKIKSSHGDAVEGKSGSLGHQILADKQAKFKRKTSEKNRRKIGDGGGQEQETFIGTSLSKKILHEALKQQQELQRNEQHSEHQEQLPSSDNKNLEKTSWRLSGSVASASRHYSDDLEDAEDDEGSQFSDKDDFYEPVEIDEEEEEALEKFMSSDANSRRTLADIIQHKIGEKQLEAATQFSDVSLQLRQLDPRLVEMYKGVRDVLKTYRSGKLPKAFKIIPNLVNWEQILELTEPDKWTAAAMYQATRIFVSNLNAKLCQRFLNLVLLPRIRDDIAEYKKLNFHLYQALRKALFKPGAFFKGFLLPLCEGRTCTLREATIISSVLTKCSVPVLHAAAAMLKIAEMDYSGANSLFLRTLIDKKYTLPFRVIDALVAHFVRFQSDKREMPVLWHQALLSLVQRYKSDISSEQRERLLELMKVHHHYMISLEVRRELVEAVSRDAEDGSTIREDHMDF